MREPDLRWRLIDINELAKVLSLAVQTIRNQVCNGLFPIPPKKIGGALRWDTRDVEKFLDNLKPLTKPAKTEKIIDRRR